MISSISFYIFIVFLLLAIKEHVSLRRYKQVEDVEVGDICIGKDGFNYTVDDDVCKKFVQQNSHLFEFIKRK